MAFKKARMDDDSLHKVMQGDELVAIKCSFVLEDDDPNLGSRRVRVQMSGPLLEEWIAETDATKRQKLLRKYCGRKLKKAHTRWKDEPPQQRAMPLDVAELGDAELAETEVKE